MAAALLVAGLASIVRGADARFIASLDRPTIALGQDATLALTFSGGGPDTLPTVPAVNGLQITYGGQSSQMTIVNGAVSSTVTHSYTVTPRQAGDFTIPPVTAVVGGQTLKSDPIALKVLQPTAPTQEAINAGSEVAFMRIVLPKREMFVGETMVAELDLYLRQDVQDLPGFQFSAMPADGFSVGKLARIQNRQTQVGKLMYNVIPWSMPIRATRTGNLTLGPVTATAVVETAARQRRRNSFFDMDSFFGGGQRTQVPVASDTQPLICLALPTNAVPAGFNGAVGSFSMSATAAPTNVAVGDPITVRVQISGRGAWDNLTLPEQAGWGDFKTYPATSKVETSDPLGIQGTKQFEQTVVPQKQEIKELPAIRFSFFDPERKQYQTVTQPAIALVVRPSGSLPAPTVAARGSEGENQPPAQDIVHIKPRFGTVAQLGPPLALRPWFWFLESIPVLAWAGSLLWRRRQDELARNPRLRRQRQVKEIIEKGLIELRRLAAENKSEEFFAALFRLLQEQLGERLDLPASAITEAVIDEHLRPRKVSEGLLNQLRELFDACNAARYAPEASSGGLTALALKFEATVGELRGLNL